MTTTCKTYLTAAALLMSPLLHAQTDADALTMAKGDFCSGLVYQHSSWTNYWEGTLKRDNQNIGRFTNQMVGIMGNYGVTKRFNVLFNVPYVITSSNAGQWKGQQGIQDLSLWLKYVGYDKKYSHSRLRLLGLAGLSTPLTNYSIDQLPYSIGVGSTNLTARAMADYQMGKWFATASASYVWRSNVQLDRTAYYTDALVHSNEVYMSNATQWTLRAGYRYKRWIAEAVADNWTTLDGHDITRNNMPFVSNKMDMTRLGVNLKWEDGLVKGLSLLGGANYTLSGRNVGQATTWYTGAFYLVHLGKKPAPAASK